MVDMTIDNGGSKTFIFEKDISVNKIAPSHDALSADCYNSQSMD